MNGASVASAVDHPQGDCLRRPRRLKWLKYRMDTQERSYGLGVTENESIF